MFVLILVGCAAPQAAPQESARPVVSTPAPPPQATLIFTATQLERDYLGKSLGAGSLQIYSPGGQCLPTPHKLAEQEVDADHPRGQVTIPAGTPLVLASFWSAAGATCLVGNHSFTARADGVYKLTSVQDTAKGVCRLRLQRLTRDRGRYVEDRSLRRIKKDCGNASAAF